MKMMKFSLLALLLLLSVTVCFGATLPEQLQSNTVVLANAQGHGSGVLFTRDSTTFVWTAAHVTDLWMNEDGSFRTVQIIRGSEVGEAKVLRAGDFEMETDCSLLILTKGDMTGDAHFYRAFNEVKVGQKVWHCGSPRGYDNWTQRLVSEGVFAAVFRDLDGPPLLAPNNMDCVDITAYGGCSGGPVVDAKDGGIVGLLVMGSQPRMLIIEPTRNLYTFAKSHNCLWAFDREVPLPKTFTPWPGDKIRRISTEKYNFADCRWGETRESFWDRLFNSVLSALKKWKFHNHYRTLPAKYAA